MQVLTAVSSLIGQVESHDQMELGSPVSGVDPVACHIHLLALLIEVCTMCNSMNEHMEYFLV